GLNSPFADCLDQIDPGFDFEKDEYSPDRRVQRDDVYPHEYFDAPPYDGILVSRAILGGTKSLALRSPNPADRM
ncbi:unnamed protein product, partial [marine sediment metagenome]